MTGSFFLIKQHRSIQSIVRKIKELKEKKYPVDERQKALFNVERNRARLEKTVYMSLSKGIFCSFRIWLSKQFGILYSLKDIEKKLLQSQLDIQKEKKDIAIELLTQKLEKKGILTKASKEMFESSFKSGSTMEKIKCDTVFSFRLEDKEEGRFQMLVFERKEKRMCVIDILYFPEKECFVTFDGTIHFFSRIEEYMEHYTPHGLPYVQLQDIEELLTTKKKIPFSLNEIEKKFEKLHYEEMHAHRGMYLLFLAKNIDPCTVRLSHIEKNGLIYHRVVHLSKNPGLYTLSDTDKEEVLTKAELRKRLQALGTPLGIK